MKETTKTNLDFINHRKPEMIEVAHLVMTNNPDSVVELVQLMDDTRLAVMLKAVHIFVNIIPLLEGVILIEASRRGLDKDKLNNILVDAENT